MRRAFATDAFRFIGQPIERKEDKRLLRGQGRFSDDICAPGQLYAAMVRSPYAHACFSHIDGRSASAIPGVLGVFSGAHLERDGLAAIDHRPLPATAADLKLRGANDTEVFVGPHALLPNDRARHVGEAVAMVVASSPMLAQDGAEAVAVDWQPLAHVCDADKAHAPEAPKVWPEHASNVCVDSWHGDRQRTDALLNEAAHVFSARYRIGRVTGVPLEPRSALALYDAASDSYTLYAGSGGAVRQRGELASVLGITGSKLRVVSPDVGGNFGTRNRVYVEFALVLWAARRLGRPVKYTATRSESFLSDYQGRDLVSSVSLGVDAAGRFTALKADNLSNLGARAVSLSPLGKGSALITGSYLIDAGCVRARAAFSNTVPTQAYRSSGRPEVNFALERSVDKAARALGEDPVALRRRNLVDCARMPYTNPIGACYDSGEYERALDAAVEAAHWASFAGRRSASEASGRRRGLGIAHYVESSIGSPHERTDICIDCEGRVRLTIGTQPTGQGQETSFAQVAADLLGIDFDQIDVITGDTAVVSAGGGSHSGRSMRHAGTVISLAVSELTGRASSLLALHVGGTIDASGIEFDAGVFRVVASNQTFAWSDVAALAAASGEPAWVDGIRVVADNEMHTPVFPNGCATCEVEVDPHTGAVEVIHYVSVDDVGRAINPLILHGQAHGSIAQGLGQALLETCHVDARSGQPLCGSLLDYALPRADMMPAMTTIIHEVLSPTNPLGIKSGGEGATTPALAALVNAVIDALAPLGVHDIEMPLTPHRVWRAIQEATPS